MIMLDISAIIWQHIKNLICRIIALPIVPKIGMKGILSIRALNASSQFFSAMEAAG
jgi:hypothetical protein